VDKRPGHRQALLLAAAELVGQPGGRAVEAQPIDERPPARGRVHGAAGQARGEQNVLLARQLRDQVEELEHEPDAVAAQPRQLALRAAVDAPAGQLDGARVGPVQRAEQVQQRGLPRARPADDGHELARAHLDRGAVEHAPGGAPAAVRLHQASRRDHDHRSTVGHRRQRCMKLP
jgi:hypothetical protein